MEARNDNISIFEHINAGEETEHREKINKKRFAPLILFILFAVMLTGCGSSDTGTNAAEKKGCDLTISCADSDPSTITYSARQVATDTGSLRIENKNDFDVTVFLSSESDNDLDVDIKSGESYLWDRASKDILYSVGCRAGVKEGTEMFLSVKPE